MNHYMMWWYKPHINLYYVYKINEKVWLEKLKGREELGELDADR
jgi:hypothetical protein